MSGLNIDQLNDQDRIALESLAVDYTAAVSLYNDLDASITIEAREYAEAPWDNWDDHSRSSALSICIRARTGHRQPRQGQGQVQREARRARAEAGQRKGSSMISASSIEGKDDKAFEAAMEAFRIGPPGVLRRVQQHDSYPGERVSPDDPPDPDAYKPIPTSLHDERVAIAAAINAYQDAQSQERGERIARVTVIRDARQNLVQSTTSIMDLLPRIDAAIPEGESASSYIREADIVLLLPITAGVHEQLGHAIKDRGMSGYDVEVREVVIS